VIRDRYQHQRNGENVQSNARYYLNLARQHLAKLLSKPGEGIAAQRELHDS